MKLHGHTQRPRQDLTRVPHIGQVWLRPSARVPVAFEHARRFACSRSLRAGRAGSTAPRNDWADASSA